VWHGILVNIIGARGDVSKLPQYLAVTGAASLASYILIEREGRPLFRWVRSLWKKLRVPRTAGAATMEA
jgi:hypothetical protein